jgi:hypothetical protein
LFVHNRDLICLEVLLQLLLDDVVPVRELVQVPQVHLPFLAVIHLYLNLPLLSLLLAELSVVTVISVHVLELGLQRNVAFQFLGDEIHFQHLGQVLGKLILNEILLLDTVLLHRLLVLDLFLLPLPLLSLLLLLLLKLRQLLNHLPLSLGPLN